ncbi:unnamed protein product [Camellia sinensis]
MAAPLSHLIDHHHHHYGEIGLNYSGILAPLVVTSDMNMNFHLGSSSLGLGGGGGGGSGIEHRRLQQPTQISPMAVLDFPGVLYPFQGGVEPSGYGGEGSQVRPKPPGLGFTTHQLGSVKMEDNQVQELNFNNKILKLELALEMVTLIFHHLRCHHHHTRVMVRAQLGLVRWLTGPEWPTYPCQKLPRNAWDVNQQTQGFATSTTTASLSLSTFARLVGGTGREAVL